MKTLLESILDQNFDVNLTDHIFGDELLNVMYRYDWYKGYKPSGYSGGMSTKSSQAIVDIAAIIRKIIKRTGNGGNNLADVYEDIVLLFGHLKRHIIYIIYKRGPHDYVVLRIWVVNDETRIAWEERSTKDANSRGKLIGKVPIAVEKTIKLGLTK